uniref:Uncharacterized protein n=1 Tax=Anguilla anguilla TaxID=7936 RepID=A0A0E9UF22_ANGAN
MWYHVLNVHECDIMFRMCVNVVSCSECVWMRYRSECLWM